MKKELRKYNTRKGIIRQTVADRYPKLLPQRRQVVEKVITAFGFFVGALTLFASVLVAPIGLHATPIYEKQKGIMVKDSNNLTQQQKGNEKKGSFYEQEKLPEFPGGEKALIEYVQKNIRHSEVIDSLANSKYASVQFTIDHDGQVIMPDITHKVHPLVDSEILRVISSLPRWQPGMLGNQTVQVKYIMRFSFCRTNGMKPCMDNAQILYPDVYDKVHVTPEFPGGQGELMRFIAINIKNPIPYDNGISSRVIIQFIVDKEGNIFKAKVVRGVDPYLDKEALRVINLMPKWKPGELEDGTKVAVRFTVPVMFRSL